MTDSTAEPTFPSIAGWEEYNEVAVPMTIASKTVTLVIFVALVGLRLAMAWGWLREVRSMTFGLGVIGIVILALAGAIGVASWSISMGLV